MALNEILSMSLCLIHFLIFAFFSIYTVELCWYDKQEGNTDHKYFEHRNALMH